MIDFLFGRYLERKKRQIELENAVDCLFDVLNELLWELPTLPNSESFISSWKTLQNLQKERKNRKNEIN